MTQCLVWEQYLYPTDLDQLLKGNSYDMIYNATTVTKLIPPLPPRKDVLINKTGSTSGFAGYVAFIPAEMTGIVILANKNYPNDARVKAAYQVLTDIDKILTNGKQESENAD